ncbi:hypothetical protein MASR2M117_00200 [Paludibacter sp.]
MKKILFIMLFFIQTLYAQKNIYSTFEGDFPSVNLNNSSIETQQLRFGLGYAFTDNFGTALSVGCGLLGNNAKELFGVMNYYSIGINASYLFLDLKNNYRLGIEALGDYNIAFAKNHDHLSVTGALKLQFPIGTYFKIGLQNRFVDNNATLLICTFGYKIK